MLTVHKLLDIHVAHEIPWDYNAQSISKLQIFEVEMRLTTFREGEMRLTSILLCIFSSRFGIVNI